MHLTGLCLRACDPPLVQISQAKHSVLTATGEEHPVILPRHVLPRLHCQNILCILNTTEQTSLPRCPHFIRNLFFSERFNLIVNIEELTLWKLHARSAHLNNKIEESSSETECSRKRQRFKFFFFFTYLERNAIFRKKKKNTDLLCCGPRQQT